MKRTIKAFPLKTNSALKATRKPTKLPDTNSKKKLSETAKNYEMISLITGKSLS